MEGTSTHHPICTVCLAPNLHGSPRRHRVDRMDSRFTVTTRFGKSSLRGNQHGCNFCSPTCCPSVVVRRGVLSRFLITASKDLTARVYSLHPHAKFAPLILAGHRDAVVGAFFSPIDKRVRCVRIAQAAKITHDCNHQLTNISVPCVVVFLVVALGSIPSSTSCPLLSCSQCRKTVPFLCGIGFPMMRPPSKRKTRKLKRPPQQVCILLFAAVTCHQQQRFFVGCFAHFFCGTLIFVRQSGAS